MYLRSMILSLFAGSALVLPAAALRSWLTPEGLSAALAGKTIEGRYASGKSFTERYGADGRVEYREAGGMTTAGHWSITAGTFCTIYDGDVSGGCFRVARVGKNCFEFYFIARTEEAAAKRDENAPAWTARGSVSGEATSCDDDSSV